MKLPLFLGGVPQDMMDLDYLSARNVRVCLQGHHSFWASVQGVYDTLKALREGAMPSDLKNIASADMQRRVLRQDDYARLSQGVSRRRVSRLPPKPRTDMRMTVGQWPMPVANGGSRHAPGSARGTNLNFSQSTPALTGSVLRDS